MFQQRYSFTMRLQTNIPSFLSNEEQRYPRHTDTGTYHFLERHLLTEERKSEDLLQQGFQKRFGRILATIGTFA